MHPCGLTVLQLSPCGCESVALFFCFFFFFFFFFFFCFEPGAIFILSPRAYVESSL